MAFDHDARDQFWLSLLSWAVVVVVYFAGKWWRRRAGPTGDAEPALINEAD
jgi:hypothetical protein